MSNTNDGIRIMCHAQMLDSGALRCIYSVIRAIGTSRCMATYVAGTTEHAAAYAQARASGVLVNAVTFEPQRVDLDDEPEVEAAMAAITWHGVPQPR